MTPPDTHFANDLLRRILFLPPQASTVAAEIDRLHYLVITLTMLGATAITLVGVLFVVRYRAGTEPFRREDPLAHPPLWAEITVIVGLLALFCLCWGIGFAQYLRLQIPPQPSLDVYVTGKQWMWRFGYPNGEQTLATLYVPAAQPVRLYLTSRDVIHSFFVPDFRIKQDAVPGRYTVAWFTVRAPGTHQVFCTEYCGVGHSTMRAQVVALSPDDYARWLSGARRPAADTGPPTEGPVSVEDYPAPEPTDLVRVGERVAAEKGCLRCHTLDGTPHIGPTWLGLFGATVPLQGGAPVVADVPYLTESMMDPQLQIHAGFAPVMPSYHGLLTPADTAGLVELIKSLRRSPAAAPALPPSPAPEGRIEVRGTAREPEASGTHSHGP